MLSLRSLPLLDTQLPVLPFSPPSVPPPSGFPNALNSAFASFRSSPFTLSGFPYSPSGSAYSALCLFPFVLSCFAPTAVPQALISFPAFLLSMLCFPLRHLSFVRFRLGSDYSASCFFLSLLPHSPSQWVSCVHLSTFRLPVSMHPFRFWYSAFAAIPFFRNSRPTAATCLCVLSFHPFEFLP